MELRTNLIISSLLLSSSLLLGGLLFCSSLKKEKSSYSFSLIFKRNSCGLMRTVTYLLLGGLLLSGSLSFGLGLLGSRIITLGLLLWGGCCLLFGSGLGLS